MKKYTYTIYLLLLAFLLVACPDPGNPFENKDPIAAFSASHATATTGIQVSFDASASNDPDGSIKTYSWNFGDGGAATGSTVKHKFSTAGNYNVALTVTDNHNATDTTTKSIKIDNPPVTAKASPLGNDDSTFLTLTNNGPKALDWTITVLDDPNGTNPQSGDWFTIDHTSGNLKAAGNPGNSDDIKLTVRPGVKPGSYISTLRVDYDGGPTLYDVIGQVDAAQTGKFTLSSDFPDLTVNTPGGGQYPIKINRSGGFTGTVSFKLAGAPNGIAGNFAPSSTAGNSTNLNISVDNTVAPGDYKLTVRGQSSDRVAETKLNLKVINSSNPTTFSLSLDPSNLIIKQASSKSSTVSINKSGSFASDVTLSAVNVPSGVTAKFTPNPTSDNSQLKLTVSNSAALGTYEITINGTGGGKTSTIKLGLSIIESGVDPENAKISGKVTTDNDLIAISTSSLSDAISLNQATKASFVANQLLVAYNENYISTAALEDKLELRQQMVEQLQSKYNFKVISSALPNQPDLIELANGVDLLEAARLLSNDPSIRYAEPNYYIQLLDIPNDTKISEQWNMAAAGLPVAWHEENGSSNNVVVAVIDSGFDLDHPDLVNKLLQGIDFCGRPTGEPSNNYTCQAGVYDNDPGNGDVSNRHGTHVAGIVAAQGNNNKGVVGAAYGSKVKLVPIKIFNDVGAGAGVTTDHFIKSIRWAAGIAVAGTNANANPAKIINISAGGDFESSGVQDAVDDARAQGALSIAATGNNAHNSQKILSPAAMEDVVGVGAINQSFERSCFSNYVAHNTAARPGKVDIVAAGGELSACSTSSTYGVLSTVPDNDYGIEAGTSMATPLVSGVAALILSKNPGLSVAQLEQKLLAAAYYDSSNMNHAEYGKGVIRAEFAFSLPGPGDDVTVTGTSSNDSDVDTVKLDLSGSSDIYHLNNLKAGTYTVKADASGNSVDLSGQITVNLSESENKTKQNIYIK